MATRRPPVIPEIAKAYQNDPRTLVANQILAQGTSVEPVAQGKYAMADGIARALSGVAGAYMTKKQMERYGGEEADLLALRKARGVDGLSGAAAPPAPATAQTPPAAPPGAAAAASALGAPPPPPPQGAMPPIPAAPVPQPAAVPAQPPVQGAAPGGKLPFGSSPAENKWDAPPQLEAVPDAPKPVERPNAPEAVGPTKSKLLAAAYRIMADGNAYESAQGQEMYGEGLAEQGRLDESAAERRQRLIDMGYQADLGAYADAQSQDRANTYQERREVQGRNFQSLENFKERGFRADESAKDRSLRTWEAKFSASTQHALQASSQAFQRSESVKDREHQLRLKGLDRQDQAAARAQIYLTTKAGQAFMQANQDAVQRAGQTIGTINEFEKRLAKTRTGGALLGNAPGLVKWSNSDLQVLDGLTNELALGRAGEMKGALSDKDVRFLKDMMPSIRNTRTANKAQLTHLRGVMQRVQDYAISRTRAVERGEGSQFMADWAAYTNSVPAGARTDFETWRNSAPAVDRNGNVVRK